MKRWMMVPGVALLAGWGEAHERMWTFVYDTDPVPKGLVEVEPWVTYEQGREGVQDFWAWQTRLEFEYAPTPLLTVALYLNGKQTFVADSTVGPASSHAFSGVSLEIFQRFTNPRTDLVGSGFYFEFAHEGNATELEEKLILSKWVGKVNMALNLILEQEWEREWEPEQTVWEAHHEKEAVISLSGGIAYALHPHASVGLEFFTHSEWHDRLFPDGSPEHTALFLGPSLHYSAPKFWATLSVLPQLTDVLDEHSRIMIRSILGITF